MTRREQVALGHDFKAAAPRQLAGGFGVASRARLTASRPEAVSMAKSRGSRSRGSVARGSVLGAHGSPAPKVFLSRPAHHKVVLRLRAPFELSRWRRP
jgi:hypothetical protein